MPNAAIKASSSSLSVVSAIVAAPLVDDVHAPFKAEFTSVVLVMGA